jgi:hypothetical protein
LPLSRTVTNKRLGRLHTLNLFDGLEDAQSRTRLLAVMDRLNDKYGLSTLAPATMLTAFKAAPTRIAFHSIPAAPCKGEVLDAGKPPLACKKFLDENEKAAAEPELERRFREFEAKF